LTRNEVNIAAVADLVKNDHRIASRMIAESLNIPKTVVLQILKEDLGKRKLYARLVPHSSLRVEKALEMGICPYRGPVWGTWRRACLLGTLRVG